MGFSCSFVELEAKFNANPLLLNSRHFDNSRHTRKRCKENSQNSETRALIKKPVGWLTVERYSKRHLAAQFRTANGLRGIFKFSEILGSTSYIHKVPAILRDNLQRESHKPYGPTSITWLQPQRKQTKTGTSNPPIVETQWSMCTWLRALTQPVT